MLIFIFSFNTSLCGHLDQTDTIMEEKTEDEPQSLLMNLCTQQILLIWQIDLLQLHPVPAVAPYDAHMKGLLKVSHQHIPADD